MIYLVGACIHAFIFFAWGMYKYSRGRLDAFLEMREFYGSGEFKKLTEQKIEDELNRGWFDDESVDY